MVTPIVPALKSVPGHTEQDKLGPLGTRPAPIPAELRAKLLSAFHAAATTAREAVSTADRDPSEAVHEARKALRRARAVLSLMGGALPKSERRAVKSALQEARRSLSTVRDHTVAPEAFAELHLEAADRETGKRVLDNAAEAVPPAAEIKQLLGEAAARAAAQAEALEAALSRTVSWSTIIDGLATVYGEARAARMKAKRNKAAFHAWRRRTKELGYQLELLASLAGARTEAIEHEIEGVSDTLGPAVDRIMLREFIETHGLGVAPDAVASLQATIDAELEDLMETARKTAKDSFEQKQEKFARRVAKAIKRDLAPPDDRDPARADRDKHEQADD